MTAFLDGRLILRQPYEGYKSGADAVLLAASVEKGKTILDVGTGVGVIALCIALRQPDMQVIGIDHDPLLISVAQENALQNKLNADFWVHTVPHIWKGQKVDHIATNPPYYEKASHTPSPDPFRSSCRTSDDISLFEWVRFCARTLGSRGWLTCIYPTARLQELLSYCTALHLGGACIFPLWPKIGSPAKRCLVRVQKESRSPTRLLSGLVLHQDSGALTDHAQKILKEGNPLSF